jgi:hypothetical protein
MCAFHVIDDDDDDSSETLEFTVRITGATDDIGRLLDTLANSTTPRVVFDPPGWTKSFYGYELDIWKKRQ